MLTAYWSGNRVRLPDQYEVVKLVPVERASLLVLEDVLSRWQQGKRPLTDADDCYRAVRLIDQAYALARRRPER